MNKKICYCFNYSEKDIQDDFHRNNGHSSILKQITEEKQRGRCQCAVNHPEKR